MSTPDLELPAAATPPDPSTYLRRVSFLDLTKPADQAPTRLAELIHATQRVLFDGVEISHYVIDLREGWSVSSAPPETIVSFCVRTDQITPPVLNEARDQHIIPPLICGRPVLTPRTPWEEYDRNPHLDSGFRRAPARMTRVYILVPEVEIRTAAPGETSHRVDGGDEVRP